MDWRFYDLEQRIKSERIDLILPGFEPGRESMVVISPHDDDALLGAGYLIQAARSFSARVRILIVCDGRAGYSRPRQKEGIVEQRKGEAGAAYQELGIPVQDLTWLDLPDFSAIHYLGWLPGPGRTGLFPEMVVRLRQWKTTRLIIPNGHREHIDHTASFLAGVFFGPQTGDAVLADWGSAPAIKSYLVYSVWADFRARPGRTLGADRAITAPVEAEERVMAATAKFESQAEVIADLVEARKGRKGQARVLELYQSIDPRPPLLLHPYWEEVLKIN